MKAFPIIETDRLLLREATAKDAGDMFQYLSDPEVVKHMGIPPAASVEDAMGEVRWYRSIVKEESGIRWGITLKDEGKVIGSCGFLHRNLWHYRAEIGFELSREHWGCGIAGEALKAVTAYGFRQLDLERVEALVETDNHASQKLLERNGFMKEGLLRHYEYTVGKFDDLLMYSLLKEEFGGN